MKTSNQTWTNFEHIQAMELCKLNPERSQHHTIGPNWPLQLCLLLGFQTYSPRSQVLCKNLFYKGQH